MTERVEAALDRLQKLGQEFDAATQPSDTAGPREPFKAAGRARLFMDGDMWCAVSRDFTNLQESPAGFGPTMCDALNDLNKLLECPLRPWDFDVEYPEEAATIARLERERDEARAEQDRLRSYLSVGGYETVQSEQAWKVRAATAEARADKLAEALRGAQRTLRAAAGQFRDYADLHRAKGTPEAAGKAATNDSWAERCEEFAALKDTP